MKEILIEEANDKEVTKGIMEAQRAENLIKHREEIMNRPKKQWTKSDKQKKDIKEKSKKELGDIKQKFDSY